MTCNITKFTYVPEEDSLSRSTLIQNTKKKRVQENHVSCLGNVQPTQPNINQMLFSWPLFFAFTVCVSTGREKSNVTHVTKWTHWWTLGPLALKQKGQPKNCVLENKCSTKLDRVETAVIFSNPADKFQSRPQTALARQAKASMAQWFSFSQSRWILNPFFFAWRAVENVT